MSGCSEEPRSSCRRRRRRRRRRSRMSRLARYADYCVST
jgi:hypothetical protein